MRSSGRVVPWSGGIGPVGPVSGKRLVALRVPVIRGGELRYVLSVGLANDAVSSILRDAGAPEGWVGTIVDADGNTIARTRAEAEELGQPAERRAAGGDPARAATASTRARRWRARTSRSSTAR